MADDPTWYYDPSLAKDTGAPTPYIQRKIDVTFHHGTGDYGEGGKVTTTLRGYRVYCTLNKANYSQTMCSLRIWGLRFKLMQQLSTYGLIFAASRKNGVLIEAGDDLSGMHRIFTGSLINAYFDGESQPDVALQVEAGEGSFESLKPSAPISLAGAVDVATVMESIATEMGVTFENNGITAKLRDVYYPGTAMQQMRRIADHANINATVENGVLAIWPKGKGRNRPTVPLISPRSGMKGYPIFDSQGIVVTFLHRPIVLDAKIGVQTSLWNQEIRAYYPYAYTHTLQSEMPGGPWFTTVKAMTKTSEPHTAERLNPSPVVAPAPTRR